MNVPEHVENAAREGLVLIVSKDVFTGRPLRWRSRLTEHGYFLLTQENGLRYRLPILIDVTNPEKSRAQMIVEDLVPYLCFMRANVDIEIERGHEIRAAFWAARLASVIGENPDTMPGWFDEEKCEAAKAIIIARDDAAAKRYLEQTASPVTPLGIVSPDGETVA